MTSKHPANNNAPRAGRVGTVKPCCESVDKYLGELLWEGES